VKLDEVGPEPFDRLGRATAELVLGSRTAAAFEIGEVIEGAARHVGARRVDLYLVDYSQRYLQALDPERGPAEIVIDGTIAGLAFTSGEPAETHDGSDHGLWWPLVDGTERLGAARMLFDPGAPPDAGPPLEAFFGLVSEIIVAKNQYSDWFRRARRRHDLSLSAESQWRQLPPLTFTRPDFTVAGALEPAYEMGGDAFDYGHNPEGLRFDITDAMGHGVEAMLLSRAATTALRHARIQGLPLEDAYRSADRILGEQFGECRFVTGVIGHFEPRTGVLTWINAGHPPPLLIRDRAVTGPLVCEPSLPMGLGGPVVEIARQQLQPGDRILFYTDGVTEARRQDEQFGLDRLVDHLQRATLAGLDAAETLRRLSLAVLAHHDYDLTDDSSLLIIENAGRTTLPSDRPVT
jgi:hypothetical protein